MPQTLQKYTREYLFDKFRIECLPQRPSSRHIASHPQLAPPHLTPLSHNSRPILAIDTQAPRSASIQRSASSHPNPREIAIGGDIHSTPVSRTDPMSSGFSNRGSAPSQFFCDSSTGIVLIRLQARLGNGAKRSPWHATSADVSNRPTFDNEVGLTELGSEKTKM